MINILINQHELEHLWKISKCKTIKEFCKKHDVKYGSISGKIRKKQKQKDIVTIMKEAFMKDLETINSLSELVELNINSSEDCKLSLKEISSIINQITSTRKNIFSYLNNQEETNLSKPWTEKLIIESDDEDAI
jgi:hypothetical protein